MSNGTIIRPNGPLDLGEMEQSCVEALSEALEMALAGRVSSAAIVLCMDDGIAPVIAGKNGPALNICLDELKHRIRAAMFEDGNLARKPKAPSILKVRQ